MKKLINSLSKICFTKEVIAIIFFCFFVVPVKADMPILDADYDDDCLQKTMTQEKFSEYNKCMDRCTFPIYIGCQKDCNAPESCTYGALRNKKESKEDSIVYLTFACFTFVGFGLYFYFKKQKNIQNKTNENIKK